MNSEKVTAVLNRFSEVGIIPVVVMNNADDAVPLGKALMEGGLPAAEVTFRTAAAEESIRRMAENFPDMLVGAGTVLTIDQVDRAVAAGAKFIVSPGFDADIVKYCLEKDIPVCPGIQTPSELIQAVKLGLDHVKFFPAENAGGLSMINAVGAAFPNVKFMPTGGINTENAEAYLKSSRIFCAGGSWMVKGALIDAGDFDKIKELTAAAAELVKKVKAN
ncbi:MAG: bifunctional 4-hydroxy-2-oxoglutarate aldolase/2-dehydro-3-deoxy-phosphogluconate aldolase [Eubacterium sp.]|nr:bifunctional 4-hydroxy-2-oxoglutarate aldolase/2-dehydro-3-deoxy-phosphogluconate aldolase [Eubacterium sp.]SEG22660.1 2-dehydro-3-deoxyphosphogluconate aldolase / (4S)-4-hydroxy-2-oxoglutarate aldolase [Eubacterium ruminantium]